MKYFFSRYLINQLLLIDKTILLNLLKFQRQVVFYWYKNRQSSSKLGITVSTALGKAVCRNRIKRLIRAAYSSRKDELKIGYNIIVVARSKSAGATFADIKKAMDYCIGKSELI